MPKQEKKAQALQKRPLSAGKGFSLALFDKKAAKNALQHKTQANFALTALLGRQYRVTLSEAEGSLEAEQSRTKKIPPLRSG
ncbi:MAG: hypothetical protein RI556_09240 [Hydrogenovibrio sp.]|uniref:hypothetical protein n=1 Tax=Hydrogenovibrio sp. TaxID=2065821 RepID=UPI002870551A|nr:hypothetical protein [Hydrogenovibrio sp.]MDR9499346.1 hypothetical protein [Hydrogenovibrio sp.]